jgi:hypothetical protein
MWRFLALAFIMAFSNRALAQSPSGQNFTPAIGVNALMLYQNSNRGNDVLAEGRNGFNLQEAELQFASDVDPYWRFVSTFTVHQNVVVDRTASPPTRSADYVFEPEELYAESLDLPWVTLRVGKLKAAFGRINPTHTHAFPFIDAPLGNQVLLGDEGLNDVGASLAALVPLPWFSELTVQGLSGHGEGLDYYNGVSSNDFVTLVHWKNFWDISDDLTFEVGGSGVTGKNSMSKTTNILGADLTLKWRGSRSKAFIWSTEYISRDKNEVTDEKGRGIASWVQYQMALRWWVQAKTEYLQVKNQDPGSLSPIPEFQRKQSVLVGFIPSEFSGLRLQYDYLTDGAMDPEHKIMLQFNYSIGAHPAHTY